MPHIRSSKSYGAITANPDGTYTVPIDIVVENSGTVPLTNLTLTEDLRSEFGKQVDVRDLTWSVPRGMEEQVYTVSLIAIDLDEQKEAEYLADLAHGLRLDTDRCNQIHRSYGAPVIFKS